MRTEVVSLLLLALSASSCSRVGAQPSEGIDRITYNGDTVTIEFKNGPTVNLTKDGTLQLHKRLGEMLVVVGPRPASPRGQESTGL